MKILLLGAGHSLERRVTYPPNHFPPGTRGFDRAGLVTLDHNPELRPDVVHDLEVIPYPFESDSFDAVHAYEVLEHVGAQGDWRAFFAQFSELWRIIRPGGYLVASTPLPWSVWSWGDPSHRRVIGLETLTFLSQKEYAEQLDVPNPGPMSDFRRIYKADFDLVYWHERRPEHAHPLPDCCRRQANDGSGEWALRAVKPSRIVPS